MRIATTLPLLALLNSCVVIKEQHVSFAAEPRALSIGPRADAGGRPKFFLAGVVEDHALAGLVPYHAVELQLNGSKSPETCVHYAVPPLIRSRPDAILVFPDAARVTGVNNHLVYTPWLGFTSFASAATATPVMALALRAARCRLPFEHDRLTGMVKTIHEAAAAPGLLEGDTMIELAGGPALPPKVWPSWAFYQHLLELDPGAEIDVTWIRPGTGKMQGRVRMLEPQHSHLTAADSIDTRWMPPVDTKVVEDGEIWVLRHNQWSPPLPNWDAPGSGR